MTFKSQIEDFTAKAMKAADMVFRGTALDIFGKVIHRTPVDTGRARGNWQTSVGTYQTDYTSRIGRSLAEAGRVTKTWNIERPIYFVNNLPYIIPLERGSSKQSPRGMVRVTIADFDRIVQANAYKNR